MDWLSIVNPSEWLKLLLDWSSRPKPETAFEYRLATGDDENLFCHLRRDIEAGKLCWFFRIAISNGGKTPINKCNVRLEKIEKKNLGKFEKVGNFSPIFLHWANEDSDDSRDVYHNTKNYLDVVHTMESFDKFFIFAKSKNINVGSNIVWPTGEYLLHIKILGENIAPMDKIIYINFNGRWDQLKMELR